MCQNVDVWRLGFQPCQMIKMFPLTFIFPYLYSCLHTMGYVEYEFRNARIEFDLRNVYDWRFRHVAFGDSVGLMRKRKDKI